LSNLSALNLYQFVWHYQFFSQTPPSSHWYHFKRELD
jgi:hypothetical protein